MFTQLIRHGAHHTWTQETPGPVSLSQMLFNASLGSFDYQWTNDFPIVSTRRPECPSLGTGNDLDGFTLGRLHGATVAGAESLAAIFIDKSMTPHEAANIQVGMDDHLQELADFHASGQFRTGVNFFFTAGVRRNDRWLALVVADCVARAFYLSLKVSIRTGFLALTRRTQLPDLSKEYRDIVSARDCQAALKRWRASKKHIDEAC